jgi:hypothetical protein
MGIGGKRHTPANLFPGMTRYPLYRKLGCPQCRSGRVQKNLAPTMIRSPNHEARSELLKRIRYPGPGS